MLVENDRVERVAAGLHPDLGTPEEPHDLEVTLDTIIMGIDAQLGALESTGEPDSARG